MTEAEKLPLRLFVPNAGSLKYLWDKFSGNRHLFTDEVAREPIEFFCWLAATDTVAFIFGADRMDPNGIMIFSDVREGDKATGHIFVWDHDAIPYPVLVESIRAACLSVMIAKKLYRITALTAIPAAKAVGQAVGFKVEGTMKGVLTKDGERVDGWILGLLREYLGGTENAIIIQEETS